MHGRWCPGEDSTQLHLQCQSAALILEPTQQASSYTGRFIMFSVITNIYNKKTKGPNLMEFFTATGKLKKFFIDN